MIDFDIISDLFLEETDVFSWENKATSVNCIIAGNISSDRPTLLNALREIAKYYNNVFFIDGMVDHAGFNGNYEESYANLTSEIKLINNVFFMHDNIIMLKDIAIVATNAWTTLDFLGSASAEDNIVFLEARDDLPGEISSAMIHMAKMDVLYLENSIDACTVMDECNSILMITNAVPLPSLISHDLDYSDTVLGDITGNSFLPNFINKSKDKLLANWVFGRYDGYIDQTIQGVRFLNNPARSLDLYYPKVLTV